ncbi:hypothetical protein BDW71DRAFT_200559 [Aspergillus fruticulosus]
MATLKSLEQALRSIFKEKSAIPGQPLSDTQLERIYQEFIVPQLAQLFVNFDAHISLLEIGPGRTSVLGCLPIQLRQTIKKYTTFDPNSLFAAQFEDRLCHTSGGELPLSCLEDGHIIHRTRFRHSNPEADSGRNAENFDVILFCHSLYGISPKRVCIERSLEMLTDRHKAGIVVVFHREHTLCLDGLVSHRRASLPTGAVKGVETQHALHIEWRAVCRAMGHCDHSLEAMIAFSKRAIMLPALAAQARLHRPAVVVTPTTTGDVQQCVRWAIEQRVSLTVIGGGHSGHCLWPDAVSVDMGAFNQVQVYRTNSEPGSDIIRSSMAVGLTVSLGSRPSVGAGLWLQGVTVKTAQILGIGSIPSEHWPTDAVRPKNEADLLWALKSAGTNMGIVISVTFQAFPAPSYSVQSWLPRHCSADAYLHWDRDRLQLGVTAFEARTAESPAEPLQPMLRRLTTDMGPADNVEGVDCAGLFDCELCMSRMHGGHGRGKTCSFKRCLFLKDIGKTSISDILVSAIETRPSPLGHLLHGGGAVSDVALHATAFGSRDWDYACVMTGVWPRALDQTDVSDRAIQWVYDVARNLLPVSHGVYGADLGPDPRDPSLAAEAFKSNGPRLAGVKRGCDPYEVLAYGCPVPKTPTVIILVTGLIGCGKDYCASIWASRITAKTNQALTTRHRPALTAFFQQQLTCRPQLPEEHFLEVIGGAVDADVLLITGMRDETPGAVFSKLVPGIRVIEVNVTASEATRRARRATCSDDDARGSDGQLGSSNVTSNPKALGYRPDLSFHNNAAGSEAAEQFAERCLLPFCHENLQQLAKMVRLVPDFPFPGVNFCHVLNIAQQQGRLELCVSLLQTHFAGDWSKFFAAALSVRVNIPLALICEGGKLPPPLTSVLKPRSHISSLGSNNACGDLMEMEEELVPRDASVVVVDDVLASGHVRAEKLHDMVVAEFLAHGGRDFLCGQRFGRVTIQSLLVLGGF